LYIFLRTLGYKTHIFTEEDIGGIPFTEISNDRLQNEIVEKDIDFIKDNFIYELNIGKVKTIEELKKILRQFL